MRVYCLKVFDLKWRQGTRKSKVVFLWTTQKIRHLSSSASLETAHAYLILLHETFIQIRLIKPIVITLRLILHFLTLYK